MPVDKVAETLTHMWDSGEDASAETIGYRASQMNLLIHFGMKTTVEEALQRFHQAVDFAQRYPCRIIVLCPNEEEGPHVFEGKVFSQCFVGSHLRDVCCCEALLLGFSPDESAFLESQMSLWLESDLPVYNWFHRVPVDRIARHYGSFIKRSRRIVIDRCIDKSRYDAVDFGDRSRVRDLAYERTLPMRQQLGQYLSGFAPEVLIDELVGLDITVGGAWQQTAQHLLEWHRVALNACAKRAGDAGAIKDVNFRMHSAPADALETLQIRWSYSNPERYIHWQCDFERKAGHVVSDLGKGRMAHAFHLEPISPAVELAEALFFG